MRRIELPAGAGKRTGRGLLYVSGTVRVAALLIL